MASKLIYGIDVSHNNGTIDWEKVQSADPPNSFVFIKATEGVGYVDPMCLTNANAVSQKTKMRFGYYHFASLNNSSNVSKDATDEANWFVQTMQTMPEASIIPVLDIERNDSSLTPTQVQEWISAFMSQMDVLGYGNVILYSYVSFLNDNLPSNHPFGTLPLWIAHYTSNASPTIPNGWTSYTLWQYSGSGSVTGVSTQCDMNKGDSAVLQQQQPRHRPSRSHTRPGFGGKDFKPSVPLMSPKPVTSSSSPTGTETSSTNSETTNPNSSPAIQKPEKENHHSFVSVKKGKKNRFVFFGLKLGHAFFMGFMYGRPDEEMKDRDE
jgi:GH25 family lysozyme M1 (1,4-beta-N-acetylmuramidase)